MHNYNAFYFIYIYFIYIYLFTALTLSNAVPKYFISFSPPAFYPHNNLLRFLGNHDSFTSIPGLVSGSERQAEGAGHFPAVSSSFQDCFDL